MKQKIHTIILAISFLIYCGFFVYYRPAPLSAQVLSAMETNTIVVTDSIPKRIIDLVKDKEILVLGETHYVQEHQVFVSKLLKKLHSHGYRTLLNEGLHALSWVAEDYVSGRLDELPDGIAMFDQYWLDRIRDFNTTQLPQDGIIFQQMDMNHWDGIFKVSLQLLAKQIDTKGFFEAIINANEQSPVYSQALGDARAELQSKREKYVDLWSDNWVARIDELLEIELESWEIRRKWNSPAREELLIRLTERRIQETDGKVIVNCGMNHAQIKRFRGIGPGGSYQLLGEFLAEEYDSYSIAFYGVRGEQRSRFYESDDYEVSLAKGDPRGDLLFMAASKVENTIHFLHLEDSAFATKMWVNNYRVVPNQQFNAYVLYPKISVLNSLRVHFP